jgi:hypothetical protein
MTSLGLNVHGQNTAARSLYDSLGYQVMTQQMRKPLLRLPAADCIAYAGGIPRIGNALEPGSAGVMAFERA